MKCKTCGKNADSEYCFAHKSRKPLPSSGRGLTSRMSGISNKKFNNVQNNVHFTEMREFFLSIWKKRAHRCENCDAQLGSEPLSYMFDHVLEKSKYPDLRYEEENICMLCLDCHSDKTNCKLSDFMKEKIKKVRYKFGK
jgi:hypothetical protein